MNELDSGGCGIPSVRMESIELSNCPLSYAQDTASLRIRDGQQGHAYESSAPRIRLRRRKHLAEAYALGGPMKDRLRRWLIPMAIARIRFMQRYRGRPRTSRRSRVGRHARYTEKAATGCKRKPFAAIISIRSRHCLGNARTCNRRRLSRRKPAAAGRHTSSRVHDVRDMQLAGSPAVVNRPAEAALCLQSCLRVWSRVYHPNMAALARTSLAHRRPLPICDQCQLEVDWPRLCSHALRSRHIAGLLEVGCEG